MTKSQDLAAAQTQSVQAITPATAEEQTGVLLATIQQAVADGRDADTVSKLLDSVERVMDRKAKAEYFSAFQRAQGQMKPVGVRGMNNHTRQPFPLLEDLQAMAGPVLAENGFRMSFWSDMSPKGDGWVRVMVKVSHVGGYEEIYSTDLPEDREGAQGKSNKSAVQAIGSTETYGQRYLYTKVWNIPISRNPLDDDGETAAVELIDENQAANLRALLDEVKADEAAMLKYFKIKSIDSMAKAQFPLAIKMLEKKREKGAA